MIYLCPSASSQYYAVISGKITNARKDSLSFKFNNNGKGIVVKAPVISNTFYVKLTISEPTNIEITDGVGYVSGIIEPKDSIIISADFGANKTFPVFEGRGKGKFIYKQSYKSLLPLINDRIPVARLNKNPLDYLLAVIDSVENSYLKFLNTFKNDMSNDVYQIFRGDLVGYLWQVRSNIPFLLYNESYESLLKRKSDSISEKFNLQLKAFLNYKEIYSKSAIYVLTVAEVLKTTYKSNYPDKTDEIEYKYKYVSQNLPNKLRVPVISRLLTDDIKARQNKSSLEKVITRTFTRPADSSTRTFFTKMSNDFFLLKEGDKATDFTLENEEGEKIRLSDFRGRVVYMDFWFADCPPCHWLFNQLKKTKEYFKSDSNVVFLNISIDNKEVWQKSLLKFNIDGYHVFTEGKEASHSIISDYQVYGYPTNRLIDREGKFFIITPSDNPEELIKQIHEAMKN